MEASHRQEELSWWRRPQGLGVVPRPSRATTPAGSGLDQRHVNARTRANQRPFTFRVTGLTAASRLRLPFLQQRLGEQLLRARRQRRILVRLRGP